MESLLDVKQLTNYINGEWEEAKGDFAQVKNPATGETIVEVPLSTADAVDQAAAAAEIAQK